MYYAAPAQNWTRLVSILAVIALNVLVLAGLILGLGRKAIEQALDPIVTEVIQESAPPPEEPAPPPPPQLAPPEPPMIPAIEIPIEEAPPPPPPAAPTPPQVIPDAPPTPGPAAVFQPARLRATEKPPYPEASRRFLEQGETYVQICVTAGGRADRITLKSSSGSPRLDRAAIFWLEGQRYDPEIVDGRARPGCFDQIVEWELPE
jgi:protein TonB